MIRGSFLQGPLHRLFISPCAFIAYLNQRLNTPKKISISFRAVINTVFVYHIYSFSAYYSYFTTRENALHLLKVSHMISHYRREIWQWEFVNLLYYLYWASCPINIFGCTLQLWEMLQIKDLHDFCFNVMKCKTRPVVISHWGWYDVLIYRFDPIIILRCWFDMYCDSASIVIGYYLLIKIF